MRESSDSVPPTNQGGRVLIAGERMHSGYVVSAGVWFY